ncbi:MAG: protein-disulfide reductase DsbD family protein [Pseudomonadota bacterium]
MWIAERLARGVLAALLALLALLPLVAPAQGEPPHARVTLLADVQGVLPGQPVSLGVRFELDRGWHVYWQNPGDSGQAPRIDWQLPAGFTAGDIEWPYPAQVSPPPVVTYGYEDEVLLPVALTTPAGIAGTVALRGTVHYLVCKDLCLPEQATLALDLPVLERAAPDPAGQRAIATARARLPRQWPAVPLEATRFGDHVHLAWPAAQDGAVQFFPDREGQMKHSAGQVLERVADRLRLTLTAAAQFERLTGVLVNPRGWDGAGQVPALAVDVPVRTLDAAPPAGQPVTTPTNAPAAGMGLALAAGFALLGGLILNLMPCVFPVLSVKVLSFVQVAHGDPGRVRRHGLAFVGGVLVSFWLLAGLLLALRAAGGGVGWGFQLQSPGFVAAMALLLTAVGLNLMGAFEVGLGLSRLAGSAPQPVGYPGSFLTGVLAVLVATPCTAPFMGAALGFALARPAAEALTIFTALGLGMALPYLALAEMPALLARLPRPGPWMATLRQGLAFPLFATAVWLVWVLGRQSGVDAVGLLLLAALGVGFAAWGFGHLQRGPRRRWLPGAVVVSGLGFAALLGFAAAMRPAALAAAPARGAPATAAIDWQPWSAQRVQQLRDAGRPVFVDFTAAWCISCQVNKQVALDTGTVAKRFAELGITALAADWTRYDPAITQALAGFGRSGVPLYVYYPPGGEPRLLPAVLTPAAVLEAVAR